VVGWIMAFRRQYNIAAAMSFAATILILGFLRNDQIIASEAPTYNKIIGYGVGYWLWLASALTLMAGSVLGWVRHGPADGTAKRL
jgi:hypothetical protein